MEKPTITDVLNDTMPDSWKRVPEEDMGVFLSRDEIDDPDVLAEMDLASDVLGFICDRICVHPETAKRIRK